MKTNQHFLNQSTDGQDVYKFCYRNIATYLDFPAENEHLLSNIFLAVINSILAVFGTLSNIFVIITYWKSKDPSMKRLSNMIIIALAFSDLLVCAVVQPLFVIRKGYLEINGEYNCIISCVVRLTFQFCCGISFLTATIVNTERYIAITRPFSYSNWIDRPRLKKGIGISWLLYFTFICSRLLVFSDSILLPITTFFIIIFIASLLKMWTRIHIVLGKHQKAIRRQQIAIEENNFISRETKYSYLAYWIITCLCCCYTPALVILLFSFFKGVDFQLYYIILPWAETLVFFSSSASPVIFSWREKRFRYALKRMFFGKRSNRITVSMMSASKDQNNIEMTGRK